MAGDYAASLLYRLDHRAAALEVRVPTRGIGTDLQRGNLEANRKYLRDYDYVERLRSGSCRSRSASPMNVYPVNVY